MAVAKAALAPTTLTGPQKAAVLCMVVGRDQASKITERLNRVRSPHRSAEYWQVSARCARRTTPSPATASTARGPVPSSSLPR